MLSTDTLQQRLRARLLDGPVERSDDRIPALVQHGT